MTIIITEKEEILLRDTTKTAKELAEQFGCFYTSINRWRKQRGIEVSKGCKKGKSKPFNMTGKNVSCETCGKEFYLIPSRKNAVACSRICLMKNEAYKEKLASVDRSYMQTEEYKNTKRKLHTPEYRRYKNKVAKLTEKVYEENKHLINPNNYKRTIAGIKDGYHLDHVVPVKYAFMNNWKIEQVSDLKNLQMLPWRDNVTKGGKHGGV